MACARTRATAAIHDRRRILAVALVAVVVGCGQSGISWDDAAPAAADETPHGTRLVLDESGHPRFATDTLALRGLPSMQGMCASSLRLIRGADQPERVYAVWWAARPDSSAGLFAATSANRGATWDAPQSVDSTDHSVIGCSRPAPAVATSDSLLHIAYAMQAPEGTGVFFAHSMDRGKMFHSPVPVAYGERLVATAIAAQGDDVVVAYEDPSGGAERIGVAASRTQGHIFELHTSASNEQDHAISPRIAIRGRTIAVAWRVRPPGQAGTGIGSAGTEGADADSTRGGWILRRGHLP
jgi:hypothetical protein